MNNGQKVTTLIALLLVAILFLSCEKDKSLQCETERVDLTL